VLWRIAEFEYANEEEVYRAARGVDWPRLFAVGRTLRVNVTAH
jgi:putative N6-adenine-specific DNA methylase